MTDGSQSPWSSIAALPRRDQAGRAARTLLGGGAEEAGLERVGLQERRQVGARLAEAGVAEALAADGRGNGRLRAVAQREVLPPERVRPAVLAADRDWRVAGARSLESSDSSWVRVVGTVMPTFAKMSLRYQTPTMCRSHRHPVLLAARLPAGGTGDAVPPDPASDNSEGDVGDLARKVTCWVSTPPCPTAGRCSAGCCPAERADLRLRRVSFWIGTFVILMVGCVASKPLMALVYTPSRGCVCGVVPPGQGDARRSLTELELDRVLLEPRRCCTRRARSRLPPPPQRREPRVFYACFVISPGG